MRRRWTNREERESTPLQEKWVASQGQVGTKQRILFTGGECLASIESNPQQNQSLKIDQSNDEDSVAKHDQAVISPQHAKVLIVSDQNLFEDDLSNRDHQSKRPALLPLSTVYPIQKSGFQTPQAATQQLQGREPTFQSNLNVNTTQKGMFPDFSFWAIVQIRQMMERLKTRYAYANLKSRHYALIDDVSVDSRKKDPYKERSSYEENEKGNLVQFLRRIQKNIKCWNTRKGSCQSIGLIFERVPVFPPSNAFKLLWDFFKGLCLLVMFFCIPLHIAVNEPMKQIIGKTSMTISALVILSDVLVGLNTGYFSKGQIVVKRTLILQNYISNSLLSDVIAILPLMITLLSSDEFSFSRSIFTLFFFVKVRDFSRILKRIEDQFLMRPNTTNLVALLKLLFVILFVAHLSACVWIYEGVNSADTDSWYSNDKISSTVWDPLWLDWYIKSYYFCTVTMVTVGYGDIYPATNQERVLSVGTMLLACCMYAYIVNSIGNIFSDFFRHSKEVKDNYYAINTYMEKKNISSSLKLKIKEYLSYYWDEERDNLAEKEQKIISQLSESLKRELKIEANKLVLYDSPVFHQNFSKILTEQICGIIQEHRCHPEQIVIKEKDQDDCNIYFIQKGKVEIFFQKSTPEGVTSTKSCQILEKGQYFGTFSFFTGLARQQSVRSVEFTQLLVIKRNDFIEIIKNFSDDYQQFCMIKDQLTFNSNKGGIQTPCYSCNSNDHLFTSCPITHFVPKRHDLIRKYHFFSTHHRRTKIVRKNQKFSTLKELEGTIKEGIEYLEQNESYLLDQDWLDSFYDSDNSSDSSNSSFYSEKSIEEQKRNQSISSNISRSFERKTEQQRNQFKNKSKSSIDFDKEISQDQDEVIQPNDSPKIGTSSKNLHKIVSSQKLIEFQSDKKPFSTSPQAEGRRSLPSVAQNTNIIRNDRKGTFFPGFLKSSLSRCKSSSGMLHSSNGIIDASIKNTAINLMASSEEVSDQSIKHEQKKQFNHEIKQITKQITESVYVKNSLDKVEPILLMNKQITLDDSDRSVELFPYFITNHTKGNNSKSTQNISQIELKELSLSELTPQIKKINKQIQSIKVIAAAEQIHPEQESPRFEPPLFTQRFETDDALSEGEIAINSGRGFLQQFGKQENALISINQLPGKVDDFGISGTHANIINNRIGDVRKQLQLESENNRRVNPSVSPKNVKSQQQNRLKSPMLKEENTFIVENKIFQHSKEIPTNNLQKSSSKSRSEIRSQKSAKISYSYLPGESNRSGLRSMEQLSPLETYTLDKALKKERFWKNLQKNGQSMAKNDLCSPLIKRAKMRLEGIIPDYHTNSKISSSPHESRDIRQCTSVQSLSHIMQDGIQPQAHHALHQIQSQGVMLHPNSNRALSPNNRAKRSTKKPHNSPTSFSKLQQIEAIKLEGNQEGTSAFSSFQDEQLKNPFINNNKYMSLDIVKTMFATILNKVEEANKFPIPAVQHQRLYRLSQRFPDHVTQPYEQEGLTLHPGLYSNLYKRSTTLSQGNPSIHLITNIKEEENRKKIANLKQTELAVVTQLQLPKNEEILFDSYYNFSTYFPHHNIINIIQLLNKKALDKLRIMRKIKIKKSKANVLNSINENVNVGNICEQFKRKLTAARNIRQQNKGKLHSIVLQTEDEGNTEKSPSSSLYSKNISPNKTNFQKIVRKAMKQNTNPLPSFQSMHSIYSHQNSNQNPIQAPFSKFKN